MQFSIMEYITIAILRDIYNYLFIKLYIVPLIYLQFSKNSRIFFFFFFPQDRKWFDTVFI